MAASPLTAAAIVPAVKGASMCGGMPFAASWPSLSTAAPPTTGTDSRNE